MHNYEGAVKEVDVRFRVSGGDRGAGAKEQKTEVTIYTLRHGVVRALCVGVVGGGGGGRGSGPVSRRRRTRLEQAASALSRFSRLSAPTQRGRRRPPC